jgi:hypothetical protein
VQRERVRPPLKVVESRNERVGESADGVRIPAGHSFSGVVASERSHPGIGDRVEPYNESAW